MRPVGQHVHSAPLTACSVTMHLHSAKVCACVLCEWCVSLVIPHLLPVSCQLDDMLYRPGSIFTDGCSRW